MVKKVFSNIKKHPICFVVCILIVLLFIMFAIIADTMNVEQFSELWNKTTVIGGLEITYREFYFIFYTSMFACSLVLLGMICFVLCMKRLMKDA